ncbi:hypothetical protein [Burkholderia glumae]|uniref:hypothetical protein n=1 Tax=Burkholderia glumae TaxID=337 RepID=UPI003F5798B1
MRALLAAAVTMPRATDARDDRLDRWALHPVFGLLILAAVMFVTFQAVYSIGKPLTDAIGDGFGWLGTVLGAWLPDGPLRSLLTDGILTGLARCSASCRRSSCCSCSSWCWKNRATCRARRSCSTG